MRAVIAICLVTACRFSRNDAALDPDADAPLEAGEAIEDASTQTGVCIGTFFKVCVPEAPVIDHDLTGVFDTDIDAGCAQLLRGPVGPQVCVLIGNNLNVTGSFRATGARPLVLAAYDSITISAELSVSSATNPPGARGAGSVDPMTQDSGCSNNAIGGATAVTGGGGGAGGTHQGAGGTGGRGDVLAGGAGGLPSTFVMSWAFVRGGCFGGRGGDGTATGGLGGLPGGAVHLIAGTKIQMQSNGAIAASGAGGRGGGPSGIAGGGGGGGGSGGFIGLDSPMIILDANARIVANGGGGGGGGQIGAPSDGGDGKDVVDPALGGGNGGVGSVASVLNGSSGSPGVATQGGGGGGGGTGVIIYFDGDSATGLVSPPRLLQ